MNEAFYFGVWDESQMGHHLHTPEGRIILDPPRWFPVRYQVLDGGLLPHSSPQLEGLATLVHINGWTIFTFWDRSVDHRQSACSAFVFKGRLGLEEVCSMAKRDFPTIWSRFAFPIVLREVDQQSARSA